MMYSESSGSERRVRHRDRRVVLSCWLNPVVERRDMGVGRVDFVELLLRLNIISGVEHYFYGRIESHYNIEGVAILQPKLFHSDSLSRVGGEVIRGGVSRFSPPHSFLRFLKCY